MKRRTFLASVATATGVGLAGCTGGSEVDGETVVDETVTGNDTATFRFDAESGQTITVYAENAQGYSVHVLIRDPDGGDVLNEQVDTEDTFSRTAEATGAYSAHVTPTGESGSRGVIQIGIE
jgi:plastocyanin